MSEKNDPASATAHLHGLLRSILPAQNTQEGSPANTFTAAELEALQDALEQFRELDLEGFINKKKKPQDLPPSSNQVNILGWGNPNEEEESVESLSTSPAVYDSPTSFRDAVRAGKFTGPTNNICPGYLQCNLVVLPAGQIAFDFLLFCQRNPKACPLLEVCESFQSMKLAPGADLRNDIPKYAVYRNGKLDATVTDASPYWPKNAVAFLIGCSFSYDGALQEAGIPLKSADAGRNVPMYETNMPCEPAGSLHGNMVVSMKPIPCCKVSQHVEITSKYQHAHGGPVCVGSPSAIGIKNLAQPEWGDPIDMDHTTEVPVFHACGVTPQAVLIASQVPFAITHAAGHMFVTDQPSDMGLL